jgi:hypothetical protein
LREERREQGRWEEWREVVRRGRGP